MPGKILYDQSFRHISILHFIVTHGCFSCESSQELISIPPLNLAFSRNQTYLIQNPIFIDPASQVS